MHFDQEINVAGTSCALTLLKVRQALKTMHVGQCLKVIAQDVNVHVDFQSFAHLTGNVILNFAKVGEVWHIFLQKN